MSDFRGLYDIRAGKEADVNLVLATFLRGLYYGESWFSLMAKASFMENYKKVANHLVTSGSIQVACLKDDPDVILGYSLLSRDHTTLHWVFVKAAWRGKGIAKSLVPSSINTITHLSDLGRELLPKLNNAVFDPFKI